MSEVSEDNFNSDNKNLSKKPSVVLDVFIGIGISTLTCVLGILLLYSQFPNTIKTLASFSIIAVFTFCCVKFFRTKHTIAAIIMLSLTGPLLLIALLVLLIYGACSFMLNGLH